MNMLWVFLCSSLRGPERLLELIVIWISQTCRKSVLHTVQERKLRPMAGEWQSSGLMGRGSWLPACVRSALFLLGCEHDRGCPCPGALPQGHRPGQGHHRRHLRSTTPQLFPGLPRFFPSGPATKSLTRKTTPRCPFTNRWSWLHFKPPRETWLHMYGQSWQSTRAPQACGCNSVHYSEAGLG